MEFQADADLPPILTVEGVNVWLSGRQILHDVNFRIEAGEFTGLIGSNGAGKTTLLRVILGLESPTSGRVLVGGRPRSPRNPLIGYVPQKILLDPDMPLRARDLVALGLDGHRFGLPRRSTAQKVLIDEMIDAVDATSFADARVGVLSGGEQQRVLIAHALISRPRLLLLDEPLANLDIRSEQEVVELVARIASEQQIAVLIYVAAGRVASGTTEEVVTTEALSELYGHHVDVVQINERILVVAGRETAAHHDHSDSRAE